MRKTCSVKKCIKKVHTRGLCKSHKRRVEKHGDVCSDVPVRQGNNSSYLTRLKMKAPKGMMFCPGCLNYLDRELFGNHKVYCKACRRDRHLLKSYGIDTAAFNKMLEEQDGLCGLCGSNETGGVNENFNVDHCHKTGTVRGLLCHDCNLNVMGSVDKVGIENIIKYLERT